MNEVQTETATDPKSRGTLSMKEGKVTSDKSGETPDKAKAKTPAKETSKEKSAKKADGKKEAKTKKEAAPANRTNLPADTVVKLPSDNPHRKGSKDYSKFNKLKALPKRTVEAALEAGVDSGYLNYMVSREVFKV